MIYICCVGFASFDVVCDELMISVCLFIVSKAFHIECYSDCSCSGSHLVEPFCYGVI